MRDSTRLTLLACKLLAKVTDNDTYEMPLPTMAGALIDGERDPWLTESDCATVGEIVRERVPGVTFRDWQDANAAQKGALIERALKSKANPPRTVYWQGEQSYSLGEAAPKIVSREEHYILRACMKQKRALATAELEREVANPARIIKQLAKKFPGAVRLPKERGDGYYMDVRKSPGKTRVATT